MTIIFVISWCLGRSQLPNICRVQPSADRNSKDHVEHSTPIESGDHGHLITKTPENVNAGEGRELNRGRYARDPWSVSLSTSLVMLLL